MIGLYKFNQLILVIILAILAIILATDMPGMSRINFGKRVCYG